MDVLLDEFLKDLDRCGRLLTLLHVQRAFRGHVKPSELDSEFVEAACSLHDEINACHADLVVVAGSMVLYIGGRFEYFVKERFKEACETIAKKCATMKQLPSPMQDELIRRTAEVMGSPRKFGHGEKGVESFVRNLAGNLSAEGGVGPVNAECLAITSENMRTEVLRDLFARIGAKDVWRQVAEQAGVRTYFSQTAVDATQKLCRTTLEEFMDVRNKIAHPSAGFEWPDGTMVEECIKYFRVIGTALSAVIEMYENSVRGSLQSEIAAVSEDACEG